MGTLANRARLLTEFAMTTFAQAVYANRSRLRRIWVLSPWIGGYRGAADPVSYLVEALEDSNCSVNIITRRPVNDWHREALKVMWENFHPTLYYCPNLHTKLYVLECDGFRSAVFGSPNLTARADCENHELAIEFRTSMESREDDVSALITDFTKYAVDLASQDDVELISNP